MTRSRLTLLAAVAAVALSPAAARADGLPVGSIDAGPSGVTTPGGPDRFVTLRTGRDTLVARDRRAGGQVRASRVLRGSLAIPAVALDGSAGGLAADGRTLVVLRPRTGFPQARTRFVVPAHGGWTCAAGSISGALSASRRGVPGGGAWRLARARRPRRARSPARDPRG